MPTTAPMDELLYERLGHRGRAGEDVAVDNVAVALRVGFDGYPWPWPVAVVAEGTKRLGWVLWGCGWLWPPSSVCA